MRFRPLFLLVALVASRLPAADFPTPYNAGVSNIAPPMAAPEAAAALKLPAGFRATLFAGEPDVQNPVAMSWDGRGRLWIAENYTYAERAKKFDLGLRDRVLVFEDAKGDGHFTSRRVFTDDVQRLSSVAVGLGGVWLMCAPQLLFIPDKNGDAVPDGPAEVVLDGFTISEDNYHTFANGLRFGPDGWLYGRCGASSPGEIGAPGTSAASRIPIRGTMWRYHPQRKIFETLSSGTTNPWGHDWDRDGELFFINTVNGHLWHSIPGAHHARGTSIDPNPYVYELIDQHADHWHFDTSRGDWMKSRDGAANDFGGGHAHAGVMIYQGTNWPTEYRDHLYTLNFHGRRANAELLARSGSGYVGKHGPDFFLSADPWFRGIDLASGPDGGVFVLDWSDTGECHQANGINRTSGRIYKITHGESRPPTLIDLPHATPAQLLELTNYPDVWFVSQARLELTARALAGTLPATLAPELKRRTLAGPDRTARLRALWALHAIDAADTDTLHALLRDPDEHLRTWAVRLLTDAWPLDTTLSARPAGAPASVDAPTLTALEALARSDPSGLVRLALASTLQRLPVAARPPLAAALASRAEDATDHNLPLMLWYGLIPLAKEHPLQLATLATESAFPTLRRLAARRLAEDIETAPDALDALIAAATKGSENSASDLVEGLAQGLTGRRRAAKPATWDALRARFADTAAPALRERIRSLDVLFGDGRALAEVRTVALDPKADLSARKSALNALIEARTPDLREVCSQLLRVRFVNVIAIRGLALFDDPALGRQLVDAYGAFHATDRPALIDVLASRATFARALLQQIVNGRLPRDAMTAFHARQIRAFNDPELSRLLVSAWGEFHDSSADKLRLLAQLKSELSSATLAAADQRRGRQLFDATCASCHRLYGQGNAIGPDLTGSGRASLDYLLENIIDPSAVVSADFRISVVTLNDGRVLNGFIAARTPQTLTLRGFDGEHTLARSEIKGIEQSPQSMMPEGLLTNLEAGQRADLLAYLMSPSQVPLPEPKR